MDVTSNKIVGGHFNVFPPLLRASVSTHDVCSALYVYSCFMGGIRQRERVEMVESKVATDTEGFNVPQKWSIFICYTRDLEPSTIFLMLQRSPGRLKRDHAS